VPAAFKADQKVKYEGMEMPAMILSGPHPTHGEDRWLIRKADGKVSLVRQSALSVPNDRREAVAEAIYNELSPYAKRWPEASPVARRRYLNAADALLRTTGARPLAVGDKIRIQKNFLDHATVSIGDVLTVRVVASETFETDAPTVRNGNWTFRLAGEGTGWERV
jgi:hypothetical protein